MFKVLSFKSEHLLPLLKQPINRDLEHFFLSTDLVKELEQTTAVTFAFNSKALVCGGITPYWPGRGQAWCVFSEDAKNHFLPTFRAIKRWLGEEQKNFQRIEICVGWDFEIGKRRAEMLGFELECARAKKYLATGQDCALYALVRE